MNELNLNNKRIAKNTLMLYVRMLITMLVSLYTVRVLLQELGLMDFGIYNLVSGLVTFFSFISVTMSSATQRYLSFSLGTKDKIAFQKIFSMNLLLYFFIALLVVMLAETFGLWFLNSILNIPTNRMSVANVVFQISLLTFIINLLIIPYHASILATERMSVYAYVSIVDVFLKLLLVYFLVIVDGDKLITYSVLLCLQAALIASIYILYCRKKIEGCSFDFLWEKKVFREILSYTGWTFFGGVSGILNNEGLNFLINLFFGPVLNAAKGISDRVSSAITMFISNFYSAVKPQIVKSYASGDFTYMKKLAFQSSKFSFFLMLLLSLPLILETHFVLSLWLFDLENSMIIFTKLILIYSMINVFEFPLTQLVHATGKVKKYQVSVGLFTLLTLPITFLLFRIGYSAAYAIVVLIAVYSLAYIPRLIIVRNQLNISIHEYFQQVIYKSLTVSLISIVLPFLVVLNLEAGFTRFLLTFVVSFFSILISVYIFGINNSERAIVLNFLKEKIFTFVKKE